MLSFLIDLVDSVGGGGTVLEGAEEVEEDNACGNAPLFFLC